MTMRVLYDFAQSGRQAPVLAIVLPGALQQPEELMEAGFADAVRRRGLPLDLGMVDAGLRHIGEATDGTALRRIEQDVLRPALLRYREIWLAGISIGGLMSMAFAARYPGRVKGLWLLGPYPGNRMLAAEIIAAGGLARWHAGQDSAPSDDDERRVWHWLASGTDLPEIHFGFGADDRFASGQRLMAESLPAGRVRTVAGGHDWQAWRSLWEYFLDQAAARFGSTGSTGSTGEPGIDKDGRKNKREAGKNG